MYVPYLKNIRQSKLEEDCPSMGQTYARTTRKQDVVIQRVSAGGGQIQEKPSTSITGDAALCR